MVNQHIHVPVIHSTVLALGGSMLFHQWKNNPCLPTRVRWPTFNPRQKLDPMEPPPKLPPRLSHQSPLVGTVLGDRRGSGEGKLEGSTREALPSQSSDIVQVSDFGTSP